ncbi:MAG: DUF3592 domain-containing protein [Ruminococcus sp.]|nr:DUF3592 domain-containing protein [Ruminococcus sp.]
MKVGTADYIWAVVSFLIVGITFHYGCLLYGLLIIYALMVALFIWHIGSVRKRLSRSVAVFGEVVEYHEAMEVRKHYYPVLRYETEDGRLVSSVYTVADTQQRYEIGSQEMICYDPDDPIFFYFANRENDMVKDYYHFIVFGSVPALLVLMMLIFR